MGHRILAPLGVAAFCLCLTPPTLALEAQVEGLEGAPADNIVNFLEGLDANLFSRSHLEGEVRRRTREALRVYGYYEPDIVVEFIGEEGEEVNLVIDPGPRVTITVMDIGVRGDAADDNAFRDAIAAFPLAEGDPLEHAPYDRLRNQLSRLALERGYFDSTFLERRMEVRPWEQSARLYLLLDSGPRYRFGEIRYSGSQIDEARLRQMLPFTPGDPYLAEQLAEYNQRLGQSNWFSSISVRPRIREEARLALPPTDVHWWDQVEYRNGGRSIEPRPDRPRIEASALTSAVVLQETRRLDVPLDIDLVPADRHQFEVGAGFATDVGPRLRFSWHQPWLNSAGHSLNHDLFLAAPDQRLTGEYIIPLEDPLRDSYRLNYGFRQRDIEDTKSLEASVELARRWQFDNGWVQSLYLRSTFEDFTQADESDQVLLLYPGISWSRTRTRNPRFPTWGDRQRLAFEYSSRLWGSDAEFLRSTLDSQWIRMLGDDIRFVGRMGLGAISTSDFDNIPPSLRFFAGGDRSVRGYSFESLAPQDEEGNLLGGQQLFTTSLEVQRRVTGNWWGAAFVDTGDAFDDWLPSDLNTGAGLGVRWISPVGPIRFDIAHPFDDEDAFRIHFAIGPEF
ncbi:outer membrane protein assembly factor [Litchfieldella qijiaojingensis]|uniref:Translocation and assembly module subunit TamA n=1 Tax=Litchfieldella qijiaojingensis TaxID=980347 RepID=A0ABQ2YCK1_9GAMM|nr:autotransporter assembly complex family protein [Halomonas qijiaojingensis]GGX79144.1 outer membrane protein assembly factor [Halomonas qijiaojingensis]